MRMFTSRLILTLSILGLLAACGDQPNARLLRETGEVLGVSESRVCQIHGQAVTRLRAAAKRW